MENDPACVNAPNGDPTTCNVARSICITATSKTVLELLDKNPVDGNVTASEIENNTLIQSLLASDIDLLDANGTYQSDPAKRDGEKDSLSIGIGFTTVKATFTAPGE
jgi:hypothetical protein